MPRFYFDFDDGSSFIRDDDGTTCETLPQARSEALRTLAAIFIDELDRDRSAEYVVAIRNGADETVYRASLRLIEGPQNKVFHDGTGRGVGPERAAA